MATSSMLPGAGLQKPGTPGGSKYVDLLTHIDFSHAQCLNEQPSHAHNNSVHQGLREDDGLFLESDADEQLLLTLPFQQVVKVFSMKIKATDADKAPKTVKLFVNRESLGFDEASSETAAQTIELSPEDLAKGNSINLKFVKFQNVRSLTIFVESNHGDEDTTIINHLSFTGCPVDTTNMNDLKKTG
mmetsp:Transcript_41999/g.50913  ORF Transcript_41999/g.50913 Transcript_41999/m.50913 type:complete len:187 (-) Transcript_41999:568-1128(-)|eukprot:CAMPEP_0197845622 /NCGR_PEP_ID=MMETSP1438-20131217/2533_1 /TAXON_ID=1461541 /ORGANISM="Pterosperma sp., Strain CCMP1384" /LENGTH=186 /DNA_ID=CAMNT_0043456993 /DNA_START=124 /DNA_END=684 /DNA_ORIENTATION=-